MPILPIDLQTIFAQMPNVGREQALQRDVAPLQQSAQGQTIVQASYHQDRSVNETNESREGEGVKPRREGRGKREELERRAAREKGQSKEEGPKEEVFRDPALGRHVDVVG